MLAEARYYQGVICAYMGCVFTEVRQYHWLHATALKQGEQTSWTQITCMDMRGSKVTLEGLLTLGAEPDVVDQMEDKDSSMLARDTKSQEPHQEEHIIMRKTTRDPDIFES